MFEMMTVLEDLPKMSNNSAVKISNRVEYFQVSFQSFGVKIGVRSNSEELILEVKNALGKINPNGFEFIADDKIEHLFTANLISSKGDNYFEITKNGETLMSWNFVGSPLSYFESQIRLTIAEFADSRVFIHAGAVGWKGQAILLPATSFSGKSTLVAELVKRGALYYSDDYAVIDENGLLHPFHRDISLRDQTDEYKQVDFSIESFGGKISDQPIPIGMVLITKFQARRANHKIWKPQILSEGQGIMEILAHTIPIRHNPKFSLEVLNKVAKHAIICKSLRGNASEFATLLLNFFETQVIK